MELKKLTKDQMEKIDEKAAILRKDWAAFQSWGSKKVRFGIRADALAAWFQAKRPDAKVTLFSSSCSKMTKPSGFAYSTGGGTRTYSGFTVKVEVDGKAFSHDTTETYRTNDELMSKMLPFVTG